MLVLTVVSSVFGANCYLVASGPGAACVIVDPGAGVAQDVRRVVDEHALRPMAILATHGHADHTWDAAELQDTYGIHLWLHEADAYRLADPLTALPPVSAALVQSLMAVGIDPAGYRAPALVRTFGEQSASGYDLPVFDGLVVQALPAPGHTQGSTLYLIEATPTGAVLTGDVLFAGTIGRTDLPGGDEAAMARTLRDVVGGLDFDLLVLPGHGAASTIATERTHNRFLTGL